MTIQALRHRGFTLVEVLAALVVIGMASVAVVAAHGALARARAAAADQATPERRMLMLMQSVPEPDAATDWTVLRADEPDDPRWGLGIEWRRQTVGQRGGDAFDLLRAIAPTEPPPEPPR